MVLLYSSILFNNILIVTWICATSRYLVLSTFCWTDPIGTVIPKVPTKSKFDHVDGIFGENIVLLCETQGHPVPVFR